MDLRTERRYMEFTTNLKKMKSGKAYSTFQNGNVVFTLFPSRDNGGNIALQEITDKDGNVRYFKVASLQFRVDGSELSPDVSGLELRLSADGSKYSIFSPGYYSKAKGEYQAYVHFFTKGATAAITEAAQQAWEKVCEDEGVEEVGSYRFERQSQ